MRTDASEKLNPYRLSLGGGTSKEIRCGIGIVFGRICPFTDRAADARATVRETQKAGIEEKKKRELTVWRLELGRGVSLPYKLVSFSVQLGEKEREREKREKRGG